LWVNLEEVLNQLRLSNLVIRIYLTFGIWSLEFNL
jgi:hypothetical protein